MEQIKEGYDIEGLAQELELDLIDLSSLYSGYIAEMQDEISEMKNFLAKKDWVMLRRIVHNIKGVSANLAINDVFIAAEELEIMQKGFKI